MKAEIKFTIQLPDGFDYDDDRVLKDLEDNLRFEYNIIGSISRENMFYCKINYDPIFPSFNFELTED